MKERFIYWCWCTYIFVEFGIFSYQNAKESRQDLRVIEAFKGFWIWKLKSCHQIPLIRLINFYFPRTFQKTYDFTMISGGIEVK